MMCIFLYLSFSIIYFIYNLKPFPNASLTWRAVKSQDEITTNKQKKLKEKEKKSQIFSHFIYILWSSLERHQDKEIKRNNKLKYSFP